MIDEGDSGTGEGPRLCKEHRHLFRKTVWLFLFGWLVGLFVVCSDGWSLACCQCVCVSSFSFPDVYSEVCRLAQQRSQNRSTTALEWTTNGMHDSSGPPFLLSIVV